MKVSKIDNDGYFIEAVNLTDNDRDPLNAEAYLIPGDCVEIEPPTLGKNQCARLNNSGKGWDFFADFRGMDAYEKATGNKCEITEIGEVPVHLTLIPKPSKNHSWVNSEWVIDAEKTATSLKNDKAEKWELIKSERDKRKSGGVKVGEKWFHSDSDSRIQQLGLVMMGGNIPAGLMWKTLDGSFVAMTQSLALQIFQAVAANDMAIFAAAETHKAKMGID